jgi:hypothetical protein
LIAIVGFHCVEAHSKDFKNPRIENIPLNQSLKHFNRININNPSDFFWGFETSRTPTDKVSKRLWVWPVHLQMPTVAITDTGYWCWRWAQNPDPVAFPSTFSESLH